MMTWRPDDGSQALYAPVSIPATAAAAAMTATMPLPGSGIFNWLCGWSVNGLGATAASVIEITITGVAGGTLRYKYSVPAGATVIAPLYIVGYQVPLKAASSNATIVLNVPSFGAGNTSAVCHIYGFTD